MLTSDLPAPYIWPRFPVPLHHRKDRSLSLSFPPPRFRPVTLLAALGLVCALALLSGCAGMQSLRKPKVEPTTPVRGEVAPVDTRQPFPEAPAEVADEDVAMLPAVESLETPSTLAPEEQVSPAPHDQLATVDLPPLPPISTGVTMGPRETKKGKIRYDYPVVRNAKVKRWLEQYGTRQHNGFAKGLERSGRYINMFRRVFREAGIPQDLVYMAHVESAYKPNAYSHAHAKGVFQFIASTARHYDLRVDYWVDERSDPEKAAYAAAAYLKNLHDEFGDWYLALASYNGGEGRVRLAIRKTGSRNFWKLADSRWLRRETKNYVPAILAATIISRDPEKFGFDLTYDAPIVYESIQVKGAADLRVLAKCAGTTPDRMRALNPALRRLQTPPDGVTTVRVPMGMGGTTLAALALVPQNERVLYARHKVRSGDTLYGIARQFGVSVSSIQQTNHMGRRTLIRVGAELLIPTAAAGTYGGNASFTAVAGGEVIRYRVRRGDTLSGIARRYGTNAASIANASGISVRKVLHIGDRLTVTPGVRNTSTARRIAQGGSTSAATYTVRRGDTLWRIARQFRTTVNALCAANGIRPESVLRPGTRLRLRP